MRHRQRTSAPLLHRAAEHCGATPPLAPPRLLSPPRRAAPRAPPAPDSPIAFRPPAAAEASSNRPLRGCSLPRRLAPARRLPRSTHVNAYVFRQPRRSLLHLRHRSQAARRSALVLAPSAGVGWTSTLSS